MKNENVWYTDGHDVTVTDSVLKIRRKGYDLRGITKHGLAILQPSRLPIILMLMGGGVLFILGSAKLMTFPDMAWASTVDLNHVSKGIGIFFFTIGAVMLLSMSERYAVTITTAEGDKNVVVSRHKEYITKIVHALNEATFARITTKEVAETRREFRVSSR